MQLSRDDTNPSVTLIEGFLEYDRKEIARMYWAAFGAKLGVALNPPEKGIEMLTKVLNPHFSIVARASDGQLLGVAGYKTATGAFVMINFDSLKRQFGFLGAIWRGMILSVLSRKPETGVLLMDGIFVAERARGQGVGTLLLNAIKQKAEELGC